MNVNFDALTPDAVDYLTDITGINFRGVDFGGHEWRCVTARRDEDGALMGVLICEFKTHFDAHCTYAITDRRCMTKRLMTAVFAALFTQAVRLTSLIHPNNHHAIEMAKRMGFKYEGRMRLAVEGKHDALVYGMLKSDCRLLKERPDHGLRSKAA